MIEIDASFGEGGGQILRSNTELLGEFLSVSVEIEGETGQPGRVSTPGTAAPRS